MESAKRLWIGCVIRPQLQKLIVGGKTVMSFYSFILETVLFGANDINPLYRHRFYVGGRYCS